MPLFVVGIAITLAAACTPGMRTDPANGNDTLASARVEARENDIIGTYIVTHVNGTPPIINIEGHEPTVTVSPGRIHFQSQCIYADWTYKREGDGISTEHYYEPGSAMCARALAPGETAIQNIFDKARLIRRTEAGLYVEGDGHWLDLQRLRNRVLER